MNELEANQEKLRRLRRKRWEAERRRKRRVRLAALGAIVIAAVGIAAVIVTRDNPKSGGDANGVQAKADSPGVTGGEAPARNLADWQPWRGPVPILMYHPIQDPIPGTAYPDLFLTRRDFIEQIDWLEQAGYEAVTLTEVLDSWFEGGRLPPKPIVLSFDDGYQSQYLNGFLTMKRLGWPGVLNLKAKGADIHDDQVKKMIAGGWEVASHSVNHLDLTTLSASQLDSEIVDSRSILDRKFGIQVTDFCFPAGRYDAQAIEALRSAGYRSATSTETGLARPSDRWSLDRIRIDLGDGADELRSKLRSVGA